MVSGIFVAESWLKPGRHASVRPNTGARAKSMRLNIVNPNTTAAMTKVIAAAAAKAARPDTVIRAVEFRVRSGLDRGSLRRCLRGARPARADQGGRSGGRRRARDRMFRRHRARCGARARERAGGRASAKPDFSRRDACASLLRRDDAVALGAGDREQPLTLRPRPALCARARVRRAGAGARRIRPRVHGRRSPTRSHVR